MMKKLALGACLACGLIQVECWGMQRSNSDPILSDVVHVVEDGKVGRSHSAPVTAREIQAAIAQWKHQLPSDKCQETRTLNEALTEAIFQVAQAEKGKHENLKKFVSLLCEARFDYSYAYYACMVFTTALQNCFDEEISKLSRMLADIAYSKSCSGGAHCSLFWQNYKLGYYDTLEILEDGDSECY